ncbi:MAG: organomercurial lyase [Acidimicrobiia bacterium]|nr:organomercurial lyase [Acidimicrobiia bacterium]
MRPSDLVVRNTTYEQFVELGCAPTRAHIAATLGVERSTVRAAWERLHSEHAIVLGPDGDLLMANPFSALPTPFRVTADGREWDANCAWDAIGICAALHCDGAIDTSCADCGDAIEFEVVDGAPTQPTLLFHCLVPARSWWEDIAFT